MQNAAEIWTKGSYTEVAPNYLSMAGQVVDRTGVEADAEVLDIGCGTGSVAVSAARRAESVVGVDLTPEMLEQAQQNAELAGVTNVEWNEADATDLPFDEHRFDVTLSSLGHMYGDPPEEATRELLRVTRPGGRIGFTSWTPTSVFPFVAGVVATYLSPGDMPEYSEPPFSWGDSEIVEERLGEHVETLQFETETALYPTLSPEHFWAEQSRISGVFVEFLQRVDEAEQPVLREEVIDTVRPYFDQRENAVELEYLLTTATV